MRFNEYTLNAKRAYWKRKYYQLRDFLVVENVLIIIVVILINVSK